MLEEHQLNLIIYSNEVFRQTYLMYSGAFFAQALFHFSSLNKTNGYVRILSISALGIGFILGGFAFTDAIRIAVNDINVVSTAFDVSDGKPFFHQPIQFVWNAYVVGLSFVSFATVVLIVSSVLKSEKDDV